MAQVIRGALEEHGLTSPQSAYGDPEVFHMTAAYAGEGSAYFVAEWEGEVAGGAGYGPLLGGDGTVCELRKMYLAPSSRGKGIGKLLLERILSEAKVAGYATIYLETVPHMEAARRLYERLGFARLDAPMGETGHGACDVWYARPL